MADGGRLHQVDSLFRYIVRQNWPCSFAGEPFFPYGPMRDKTIVFEILPQNPSRGKFQIRTRSQRIITHEKPFNDGSVTDAAILFEKKIKGSATFT